MKLDLRHQLLALFLLIVPQWMYSQFPNGGFEVWYTDSLTNGLECDNWYGLGCNGCAPMYSAFQSTDAHSGNYAVMLRTELCGFAGVPTPGAILNGGYLEENFFPFFVPFGNPIQFRPAKMTGFYKYQVDNNGTDSARAVVYMVTSNGDTIGAGHSYLPPVANYTYFEVDIQYADPITIPDSIKTAMITTADTGYPSEFTSTLWVDDLALTPPVNFSISSTSIYNGSFETVDSIASIDGWTATCPGTESYEDAPPGGGKWSIKVPAGNTQGCFPGYAYQILNNVSSGDILTLKGWAKSIPAFPPVSTSGLYLGVMDDTGQILLGNGDTTSSTSWTQLSVTDTMIFTPFDRVVAVLHGGLTAGPGYAEGAFDLIEIESSVTSIPEELYQHFSRPYPNPVTESTHIDIKNYNIHKERLTISITDATGKQIYLPTEVDAGGITLDRSTTPKGIYFYQIRENQQLLSAGKLLFN